MQVTITNSITAAFDLIGPLCQNSLAPALPLTSTNGIHGTWNPGIINTSSAGTTRYIFTPTSGQCAVNDTMNIVVTSSTIPTFNQIDPLYQNILSSPTPLTSTNGIHGTWNPGIINTSSAGTTRNRRASSRERGDITDTINTFVTSSITPTFNQIGPLCQNSLAPALPLTSTNGIHGTWNPGIINTSSAGTT